MSHCTMYALRLCSGLFLNLKTEGRAGLFKSMGISQPHSGTLVLSIFEAFVVESLNQCSWKYTENDWFYFISFFFSAAKEWHTSVVRPYCLLGKEYLSSSDRCWHYHPYVLPGTGSRPMHRHGLKGASTRQQRQTAVHWFWMGKMATLILAGAEDDVIIMVLIHTASQKIDSSWAPLARGIKRKGNWQA